MTTYTVKYRKSSDWFWRSVRGVKGDFVANDLPGCPRVLILADETRVEIPARDGLEICFGKERFLAIKQNMERETGSKLPIG